MTSVFFFFFFRGRGRERRGGCRRSARAAEGGQGERKDGFSSGLAGVVVVPLPRWSSPRARSRSTTTRGRRRGPPPRAREVPSLPCPRERARASRDVVSVGSVFGLSARTRALLLLRMRGKPRDYLLQLGVKKGNLLSFLGFQGSTISGEIDLHPGFVSDRKKEEKKKDINLAGLAQGRLPRFLLKWPFGDPVKGGPKKAQSPRVETAGLFVAAKSDHDSQ